MWLTIRKLAQDVTDILRKALDMEIKVHENTNLQSNTEDIPMKTVWQIKKISPTMTKGHIDWNEPKGKNG